MPYISNIIERQHGWGDTAPPTGQSIGAAIGGLLQTLFPPKGAPAPVVAPQSDNTVLYLGVAAAAGIGLFLYRRRKKR